MKASNTIFKVLSKHYNGNYSLARAYWANTVLVNIFALFLFNFLLFLTSENLSVQDNAILFFISTLIQLFIWIWSIKGTWSSANYHVSRGGVKVWASIVKVLILISIIRTIIGVSSLDAQVKEIWEVARGKQPGPEVTFQVRVDKKSILMKGGINDGTAELLSKELEHIPEINTLVLESYGGWISQGRKIAKVITDYDLNTYIEKECSSACTIAFLAGKERAAAPKARLGFHAFKALDGNTPLNYFDALTLKILSKLGISPEQRARSIYGDFGLSSSFISKIIGTPPAEMWYPPHDVLLAESVISRSSLGGETAAVATILDSKEKLIEEYMKIPVIRQLASTFPKKYHEIIESSWSQIEAKKTDEKVFATSRYQISKLIDSLLPTVPNSTLVEYNQLLLDQAKEIGKISPEACVNFVFQTNKPLDTSIYLSEELIERELEMKSEIIISSDHRNANVFSEQQSQLGFQRIFEFMLPEHTQYLVSEEMRIAQPIEACAAVISYLDTINSLPLVYRADTIRMIFSNNDD